MKETLISKIDKNNIDIAEIKKHAQILKNGGTVIFPTETVYGLGANAIDSKNVKKIYEAKGRPSDNPLIVHIGRIEQLDELVSDISEKTKLLMERFWPGPLTIIMKKKDLVPYETTGGLETVGIRMPSHEIALELLKQADVPVAAPSANISGRPSPTYENHVVEEMKGRVDGIILGGDCTVGLESTIIDMTEEIPLVLRPGGVTLEELREAIGQVELDKALFKDQENLVAKAPGMKYTHYSPNAQVYLVEGERQDVIEKINDIVDDKQKKGIKVGVMSVQDDVKFYRGEVVSLGKDMDEVAYNLFRTLKKMDELEVAEVYCKTFPKEKMGIAIMNRLLKAAGYRIIKA